jgi:hypothetical protein
MPETSMPIAVPAEDPKKKEEEKKDDTKLKGKAAEGVKDGDEAELVSTIGGVSKTRLTILVVSRNRISN